MRFTQSHEWIGEGGAVGISKYAQEELGEVVYVELPEVGQTVEKGEEVAVLESTKAAADLYAPVSGEIIEINEKVKENPSLLNQSPEGEGWLFKIVSSSPSEMDMLLDADQYVQLIRQT